MTEPVVIQDAYAEHVARLRERMAQEPEQEMFSLRLSQEGIDFLRAALKLVAANSPETQRAKREVETALITAVREQIRAQETRR